MVVPMKFYIQESPNNRKNILVYREEEHSFDGKPRCEDGVASVSINCLQLKIDETGKILYVCGYCPLMLHEKTREAPKKYEPKGLCVSFGQKIERGISRAVTKAMGWPVYRNEKKGWVCLGDPKIKGKLLIEFAPDCVAALKEEELHAVWLRPTFV